MYTVSAIEWVTDSTGTTTSATPVIEAGTDGVFYVKVTSTPADAVLAKENLEVRVRGSVKDFELVSVGNGVYKITIANDEKISAGDKVNVTMKKGAALTEVPTAPIEGEASVSTPTSPDAGKAGDVNVKVDGAAKNTLLVQVLEGAGTRVARAARAAGDPITTLTAADFKVTVGSAVIGDIEATYDMSAGVYRLTSQYVSDWTTANMKNVTVAVGTASETIAQLDATAKIEDKNATVDFIKGTKEDVVFTPTLTNLFSSDVKLKDGADTFVTYDETTGKITVQAAELNKKNANGQVQFTLESKTDASNVKVEYTITVKDAPKLADTKGSVTTEGAAATASTATFTVAYVADGDFQVTVDDGKDITVAAKTDANTTATALRAALNKEQTVTDKYTVGGENDKVILTAKTLGDSVATIKLTAKTADKATISQDGTTTVGKNAVAGVADLTVAAGATDADVDKAWTLTLGTKTCDVTLTATENTPELVAQKIKEAVEATLKDDVTVVISDAKLTFTEKTGKEGTVVPNGSTTVTFVKKN